MPPFVLRDFQRRVQKYVRAANVPRGRIFSVGKVATSWNNQSRVFFSM
jgi:hypothetical protein